MSSYGGGQTQFRYTQTPSKVLHLRQRNRLRNTKVSANSSKAEDPLPSEMSFENALEILGVVEGASFEEILRAKNNLLGKHSGDEELAIQVYIFIMLCFFVSRSLISRWQFQSNTSYKLKGRTMEF